MDHESRSPIAPENIGPEITARNLLARRSFDRSPILGIDEDPATEPVRNGLLANPGELRGEGGDAPSELGLPLGKRDRTLEGLDVSSSRLGTLASGAGSAFPGKVTFLHERRAYKSTGFFVKCTGDAEHQPAGVTTSKQACKVLYMPNAQRKVGRSGTPKVKRPKKPFPRGADGKTANERLREALKEHPIFQGRESELIRACNKLAGRADGERDYVSQQQVNNFMNDIDSLGRSRYVSVIAEALEVRGLWLQEGIGPRRLDEERVLRDYIRWRREHPDQNSPAS